VNRKQKQDTTEKPSRLKRRNQSKDRLLNILIGVVSIAIVVVLFAIFTTEPEQPKEQAEQTEQTEQPVESPPAKETPDESDELEEETEEQPEPMPEEAADTEQPTESATEEHIVRESADANVLEVWTNDNWTPYPTEQTGQHVSAYQVGHIDYEEKLKAFFSVIPLEKDNSIIWSVKNNGSAESSIAVLSSKDKANIYRVSIEWVSGEGWLPVQVEVLQQLP